MGSWLSGVAFDGANIWVADNLVGNVTKLRASDGANLGTFGVGDSPVGMAFANIWVTIVPNIVTKLRPSDGMTLQQFNAVNTNHSYPNVLIFANSDRQCGAEDLRGVITGNFYAKNGSIEPIYIQYSEGRIREEKLVIDVYVWWDEWKTAARFTQFFGEHPGHPEALRTLLPR